MKTSFGRSSTATNSLNGARGCTRRDVLRGAVGGALAALFSGRVAAAGLRRDGRARACILLWLDGGPSHLDTFDPKERRDVQGPVESIATAIDGVRFANYFPGLASRAGDLAVLRGMTSREAEHGRAAFLMHTGYSHSEAVEYPAWGSVFARFQGDPDDAIPPYITIGTGGLSGSEPGLLGDNYAAFAVDSPGEPPLYLAQTGGPARRQLRRRLNLLREFERRFGRGGAEGEDRQSTIDRTERFLDGPLAQALDLSAAPEEERGRFGDDGFAQGCLQALRLVEAGGRFVEVSLGGWDTHTDNFNAVRDLGTRLDGGASALLDGLRSRGLLESTLAIVMGEFGRTPDINENAGRDHHPGAYTVLLAGGGVRGGQAVGRTDAEGREVRDRAIPVRDLYATVATLAGLDPQERLYTPDGRPIRIVEEGAAAIGEVI